MQQVVSNSGSGWLIAAAVLSGAAALLHLGCIVGGPDWYRFFGAGEGMARAAARGDLRPTLITLAIATVLAVWAAYAASGAGLIPRLPLLRTALVAITAVYLPYAPGDPVTVQGQWQAWLVRERTNAAFIDPVTNASLGLRVAHGMGVGERIVHTADPLHFGTFGGLVTKLIWVVFGLMLTAMAATGAYIYAKRTKQAVASGLGLGFLDYLGNWKWPSVALITALPAVSFVFW